MIGVVVDGRELDAVEEFFELFKTPWEPAVLGRSYLAILTTVAHGGEFDSDLYIVYGSAERPIDRDAGTSLRRTTGPLRLEGTDVQFPVYGDVAQFVDAAGPHDITAHGQPVSYLRRHGVRQICRIGYDLFAEVRHLLTTGQPPGEARTPTLECHIGLLRQALQRVSVSFIEVPPRPEGHDFICCLTHDIDFFGIRRHKFDSTLAGFVSRSLVGTLADAVRQRRPMADVGRNWAALMSLPLVYLGLARDPWQPFDDYARAEAGLRSTYFLVPFKQRSGVAPDGTVRALRSVAYQASEVAAEARAAAAGGHELGVHGIDAWNDARAGRDELSQLTPLTDRPTAGIRMHWLYFAEHSPARLEEAGFDYDSTWGYNDAVGYKAGTSQVFRLPGTRGLLELPLTMMDTALFFPDRMHLDRQQATRVCQQILAHADHFGGVLVINWHCRSLAPERLWGPFYQWLLAELRERHRAWFATASEAVNWFRWRRSIRFVREGNCMRITVTAPRPAGTLPAAVLQIRRALVDQPPSIERMSFDGSSPLTVGI